MMSLTFGLFTQVSGSGPLGPLVFVCIHLLLKIYGLVTNDVICTALLRKQILLINWFVF